MGERRHDQPAPDRRYTIAEAAEALGLSSEAVRSRVKRGTLRSVREDGSVFVLLDRPDQPRPTSGPPSDQPAGPPDRTDLLIAELQDRIRALEEANRENRRIIAGLTQRIPQLETAERPPDAPETASEADERVDDTGAARNAVSAPVVA